eukprot:gene8965-1299_t
MASGGSVINEQNTINEQDDFGHSSDGHSSEGSEVFDTQGGNEYGNSYNNDHENSELEDEYSTNRDESDHGELNSFTERSIVNTVKNSGKRKGVERKKGKRKKQRPTGAAMFFDEYAEVGDDHESGDESGAEDARKHSRQDDEYDRLADKAYQRREERRKREDIISQLEKRYVPSQTEDQPEHIDQEAEVEEPMEEMYDEVWEQEIFPTNNDPYLWMVRCKPGGEQAAVIKLMRKAIHFATLGNNLQVTSVVGFKQAKVVGGKSYIYVEGRSKQDMKELISGIEELNMGQYSQALVPDRDRPPILRTRKREKLIRINQWVRVKSGLYAGDLGKVLNVFSTENPPKAEILLVPRIDFANTQNANRSNRYRPPQRLFNRDELHNSLVDVDIKFDTTTGHYKYKSNILTTAGFLLKRMRIGAVTSVDVKPTLEELSVFGAVAVEPDMEEQDEFKTDTTTFVVSDRVVVIQGELRGLTGEIISINSSGEQVEIRPNDQNLLEQGLVSLPMQASDLQKYFVMGDQVKVNKGHYKGETGLVLEVAEDVIRVLSDLSMKEIRVLPSYLEMTTTIATGRDVLGSFRLHDLVVFNNTNSVGCIFRIENERLWILDQRGEEKDVALQEVRPRGRKGSPPAQDRFRNLITIGTGVKVIDGPNKGKEGTVLHIHRHFIFFRQQRAIGKSGIFVATARHVKVIGGQGNQLSVMTGASSPSSMKSSTHPIPSTGRRGRVRRDPLHHKLVVITSGPHKGKQGIVKDVTAINVRIELQSDCRQVTVNRQSVKEKQTVAQPEPDRDPYAEGRALLHGAQTPSTFHPETPSYRGATPSYGGNRTPHAGYATPGARTPGYDFNSSAWNPSVLNIADPSTPQTNSNETAEWDVSNVNEPGTGQALTPHDPDNHMEPWMASPMAVPGMEYLGSTPTEQPFTPGQAPTTPAQPEMTQGWLVTGAHISIRPEGTEGIVTDIQDELVTVHLLDSNQASEFSNPTTDPIAPSKDDDVYVFQGPHKGRHGKVINVQGDEVIVKLHLSNGQLEKPKIIHLHDLVKYSSMFSF